MKTDTLKSSNGFKMLFILVLSLFSAQSYAMSCSARTTDGQDLCFGQDYSASVETTQDRGSYIRYGSAYVDASTGSMGGEYRWLTVIYLAVQLWGMANLAPALMKPFVSMAQHPAALLSPI